jgi:hypothetical protein
MKTKDEVAVWIIDAYEWLLTYLGGFEAFYESPLVLPTDEFFPVSAELEGHELAAEVFALVRQHAGLDQWQCRLEVQDDPSVSAVLVGIPHGETSEKGAAGTFRHSQSDEAVITYSSSLLSDITGLVATFAHELAHYLLGAIPVDPPGGPVAEEYATDVGAVFMGFGVFTANAVFNFEQFTDGAMIGWRSSQTGYLNEVDVAYALAVFTELLEIDPKEVLSFLDGNPRSYYKKAVKDLLKRRGPDLDRLRRVEGQ